MLDSSPRGCSPERAAMMREDRAAKVLGAACHLANKYDLSAVTRSRVAASAGVSDATVSNAFGGMDALLVAVMSEAVSRPLLKVLAQGLAMGDPIALAAPDDVKYAALANIT